MKIQIILASLLGASIAGQFVCAADVTKTLPRKKFRLHAVGLDYKTSEMSAFKPLLHPEYQSPGVIIGDAVTYRARLDPDLMLTPTRYTWSGALASVGQTVTVSYPQITDSVSVLRIRDANANADRTTSALTKVRSVGLVSEIDMCIASAGIVPIFCTVAGLDAISATQWARSAETRQRLGGPTDFDNGKDNAAMHAYWNILMTRDIGLTLTELIATGHEKRSYNPANNSFSGIDEGGAHNSTVMDLINNDHGRSMAPLTFDTFPGFDDADSQTIVVNAANLGTLTKLNNKDNPVSSGVLEPSKYPNQTEP